MPESFKPASFVLTAISAAVLLACPSGVARAQVITIRGDANLYGAGHSPPNDTPAPAGGGGGTAPPFITVTGGGTISFTSITGTVDFGGGSGGHGPDGDVSSPSNVNPINGISGFRTDHIRALSGVFVGAAEPGDPPPASLDFVGNTSFASLSPALNQAFFIGDGLTGTGTGAFQQFVVPAGATRLYLGQVDGFGEPVIIGGYADNTGSFQATAVPEPGSLLLVAVAATVGFRRRIAIPFK